MEDLKINSDEKIVQIKFLIQDIIFKINQSERNVFSNQEIQNMLLDIYSVINE